MQKGNSMAMLLPFLLLGSSKRSACLGNLAQLPSVAGCNYSIGQITHYAFLLMGNWRALHQER